jgi:AraC-like DNA-binding protein
MIVETLRGPMHGAMRSVVEMEGSLAPVLPGATGAYAFRLPLGPLRGHFSRTWFNELPRAGGPIAVVPDGCIDLEWIDGELRVAGPDQVVKCESLRPGATVIGLRFLPGAVRHWLGVPASEIVGARIPLESFWGSSARALAEWAGRAPDRAGAARRLEEALARRAGGIGAPDPANAFIRKSIEAAPLQVDIVRWLAAELRVSERTLRRRCQEAFGYGPKTLQRIVRFQRFLERVRQRDATVAELAVELGFADQAHLSREARRMASLTPSAIRDQLVP